MKDTKDSTEDTDFKLETVQPFFAADIVDGQSWIWHRGKRLCIRDYAGLEGEEAVRIALLQREWLAGSEKRDIRLLLDVTDLAASKELVQIFKDSAKMQRDRFYKVAAVGIRGMMLLFFRAVNTFSDIGAKPFATRKEAFDWLAEDK